jgi:hypothetical protein
MQGNKKQQQQCEGTDLVKAILPAAEPNGFFVAKQQPLALLANYTSTCGGPQSNKDKNECSVNDKTARAILRYDEEAGRNGAKNLKRTCCLSSCPFGPMFLKPVAV